MCTGRNETSELMRYTRFPETDRERRTRAADKDGGRDDKGGKGAREKGKLPVLR